MLGFMIVRSKGKNRIARTILKDHMRILRLTGIELGDVSVLFDAYLTFMPIFFKQSCADLRSNVSCDCFGRWSCISGTQVVYERSVLGVGQLRESG